MPLENPLAIPLLLCDLRLLWTFESGADGGAISNDHPLPKGKRRFRVMVKYLVNTVFGTQTKLKPAKKSIDFRFSIIFLGLLTFSLVFRNEGQDHN